MLSRTSCSSALSTWHIGERFVSGYGAEFLERDRLLLTNSKSTKRVS